MAPDHGPAVVPAAATITQVTLRKPGVCEGMTGKRSELLAGLSRMLAVRLWRKRNRW